MEGDTTPISTPPLTPDCDCRFKGCQVPLLYCRKSTNGTIVTWEPGSSGWELIELEARIAYNLYLMKTRPFAAEGSYSCVVCSDEMNTLSALIAHEEDEEKRVSGELMTLMDARVADLSKY